MTTPPKPDTRARLLEVASRLFWSQGYGYTGIAQILTEAGVQRGSFYHFFDSKADLLRTVVDQYRERLEPEVLRAAFEAHDDPLERVFAVLAGYRAGLEETECEGGCPIGNLALELSDLDPCAREGIAANFLDWRGAIRDCLQDAFPHPPAGFDPERAATFVLSLMEGAVMQARAFKNLEPFDATVAVLHDYLDRIRREDPTP